MSMGLALVQVPFTDFQDINDHLRTYMPRYQNMHLRQARQRNKRRVLRYLHAMYAPNAQQIDGMISGPGVYWSYNLFAAAGRTRIRVLANQASPADERRMERSFLQEVLRRVQEEQNFAQSPQRFAPRRLPGEFYLRRAQPGMSATHAHCVAATSSGALDPRFVSQLRGWNLELLHP
jgi:hypothetical protein